MNEKPRDFETEGYLLQIKKIGNSVGLILPKDLLYKPKRGFGAPAREWFRGPNSGELLQLIMNSRMRSRNFFDYQFVERLADEHRRERQDWSAHLWALLNVSVWYDRWIK